MSDNGYRCGHAACQCTTMPEGATYCSDYCRDAAARASPEPLNADARLHRCGCGHALCESNPQGDLNDAAA